MGRVGGWKGWVGRVGGKVICLFEFKKKNFI